jgi:tartrate dehydrogenase/decarboxylase / D-malate dehydrogenase
MLEHLGEKAAADRLMRAVGTVCADGKVTPGVGGSASTRDITQAVCHAMRGKNV